MKKFIVGILTAAMALSVSITSFAESTYNVKDNYVTSDDASGMKTVIITKGESTSESVEDSDIYYVGQAAAGDTFTGAADKFLLKAGAPAGAYTVTFGGSGTTPVSKVFYIGVSTAANDILLDRITTEGGETSNEDGTKNVGYLASNVTGSFRGVIIKVGSDYYGVSLNAENMTLANASIGIQINGVGDEYPEVWLTSRGFELEN
ncbi:MAG: hypothetical protein ACI4DP_00655 [Candidatus Ornithomonoglobus sp.]